MSPRSEKLTVAVIGCGHWGPNHLRVFHELDRSTVIGCADTNGDRLAKVARRFPGIRTTVDYHELLDDGAIDAVVIATPTSTHHRIVRDALQSGKHVLVEKPMCNTADAAVELARYAEQADRILMVGHVFLYNGGITALKKLIDDGELGHLHYLEATRTNLGPVRGDVNALYDLGTHDISIFNYLLGTPPLAVSATGSRISQGEHEDVCFATLRYPNDTLAHLHVSWLNPRKVRTITAVGESTMAHWDDVDPSDTLRVYDKGFEEPPFYDSYGEFQYLLRSGDIRVPTIRCTEPLVNQGSAFVATVLDGAPCRSGAREAIHVISTLEAAERSLEGGGAFCALDMPGSAERLNAWGNATATTAADWEVAAGHKAERREAAAR